MIPKYFSLSMSITTVSCRVYMQLSGLMAELTLIPECVDRSNFIQNVSYAAMKFMFLGYQQSPWHFID